MNYWQRKISLFLHDPVHKAFYIPDHEKRAAKIADILKQTVSKVDYKTADRIASGLTRASLPSFSWYQEEDGSINYKKHPALTHPIACNSDFHFNVKENISITTINQELIKLLENDIVKADFKGIAVANTEERNKNDKWLFFYLFFALKKRLRKEKAAGIGGLWELLPADSRMPDHSIWHHCGLTSAIGSAMEQDENVSLSVFSISPVQLFISKSRKLRDSWTASVILSYLSFIGISKVMDELGPDHIVYPALNEQILTEKWLNNNYQLKTFLTDNDFLENLKDRGKSIASFPNKFVFICATSKAEEFLKDIKKTVQEEWKRIAEKVKEKLIRESGAGDTFTTLFNQQIADYWQYSWASVKLPALNDDKAIESIVHRKKWENEYNTIGKFAGEFSYGKKTARLYGTAHNIIQNLLAASKFKPAKPRAKQGGEKCPLCGDHEVLHDFKNAGNTSVDEYNKAVEALWDNLRKEFNPESEMSQIGKKERLCAICAIKRFLPFVMKCEKEKDELLYEVFRNQEKFPSTTEIAAYKFINRLEKKNLLPGDKKDKLLEHLHSIELKETDDEHIKQLISEWEKSGVKYTNRDKYYAVLLMDGDRMGDLISGKTIGATWNDVIHPELRGRFDDPEFCKEKALRDNALREEPRLINPAVHAAISDSLNSFARFAVAPVINKAGGRLIYAGGDDVLAVLPLEKALNAAEEISKMYRMKFVKYTENGTEEIKSEDIDCSDKIGMHLGDARNVSISGAIVIAHHKEPLREVIRDAHTILDDIAKKQYGRNALAIRLKKRSGTDRDIAFKWDAVNPFFPEKPNEARETLLQSFKYVMNSISENEASSSLIYKLEQLKDAVRPLFAEANKKWPDIDPLSRERIIRLFAYEIYHSGVQIKCTEKEKEAKERAMAARLAGLCIIQQSCTNGNDQQPDDDNWFNAEGPVIGRFLASREEGQQ